MRTKRLSLLLLLFTFVVCLAANAKPKIRIIATGGTIAGVSTSATNSAYSAGQVGVQALIQAVPQMLDVADVSGEQLVNIGSQDMNDNVWLKLAKRINELLNNEGYDGVVVTHGTDTMEETAYFLNLTVHSDKPVILVGSMRPSTAISADGPGNIYAGVVAAASPQSVGRGVMVCMNNLLLDAKDVTKMHTTDVATFQAANFGKVGYVYNGQAIYCRDITNLHTTKSEFNVDDLTSLPKVGIVYGYANCSPLPMKAFMDANFDGIVLAGVGDGNFYKDVFDVALQARAKGINIVRSSRVPTGPTCLNGEVDDSKYHFIAALTLNPQKARVLLMLALTKTRDWQKIQEYFQKY